LIIKFLLHPFLITNYAKLSQVSISVLPELDKNCNTILPNNDSLKMPEPPPPPSFYDFAPFPDSLRNFTNLYEFDSDYMRFHITRVLIEAARIAQVVKAKRVEIQAYRATTLLSNGQKLVEKESIARTRAEKTRDIFTGLGVSEKIIKIKIFNEPQKADGIHDAQNRRVTIKISNDE
jgi:hypothetical protein